MLRMKSIRFFRHKNRIFIAILCLDVLLFAAMSSHAVAQYNFVAIGTGGPTGVYFQAGNAICLMLNKGAADHGHNIRCVPATTGGSVDNINKVTTGRLDFGIVQSDVQYHAYTGDAPFAGSGLKNLRAVLSLYPEALHLVVRKGSDISGWDDLKDKRVNVGSPGSGVRSIFDELLAVYGVDTAYFGRTTELSSGEQARAFCKGRIDVFGDSAGVPSPSVEQVVKNCGASMVSLEASVVQKLIADRPYFDDLTIPIGSYANMDRDIQTLGVIATVVTTSDTADEVVYEFVRAVFENIDSLRESHSALITLEAKEMACRGNTAPLHNGAKKYFSEHKFDRCP